MAVRFDLSSENESISLDRFETPSFSNVTSSKNIFGEEGGGGGRIRSMSNVHCRSCQRSTMQAGRSVSVIAWTREGFE